VTAEKKIINLELLKLKLNNTNLFDDFDPVSSNNGNKKSLNLREQITTKP
jgi:hypothetical protein